MGEYKHIETTGDEIVKKYQVLETTDGEFGVFNMDEVKDTGEDARSIFKSEYAAEAQERADELNEEHGYEVMQDNNHNPK